MDKSDMSIGVMENAGNVQVNKYDAVVSYYKAEIVAMVEMMPICLRVLCYVMVKELQKNEGVHMK
jgi:hypothetical protein